MANASAEQVSQMVNKANGQIEDVIRKLTNDLNVYGFRNGRATVTCRLVVDADKGSSLNGGVSVVRETSLTTGA